MLLALKKVKEALVGLLESDRIDALGVLRGGACYVEEMTEDFDVYDTEEVICVADWRALRRRRREVMASVVEECHGRRVLEAAGGGKLVRCYPCGHARSYSPKSHIRKPNRETYLCPECGEYAEEFRCSLCEPQPK